MTSSVRYVLTGSPSQSSYDTRHVALLRLILIPYLLYLPLALVNQKQ